MVALIPGAGVVWRVTELARRAGRAEWEVIEARMVRRAPRLGVSRDGVPVGAHPPNGAVMQEQERRNVERPRDQALKMMRPVPRRGRFIRPEGTMLLSDARRAVVDYWRGLPKYGD
jgi:hypothetical protein